jgi:IS5 family transposase
VLGAHIILPKKALKRDNRYQRDKKRKLCKRRAAIEPIIGHLKLNFVRDIVPVVRSFFHFEYD